MIKKVNFVPKRSHLSIPAEIAIFSKKVNIFTFDMLVSRFFQKTGFWTPYRIIRRFLHRLEMAFLCSLLAGAMLRNKCLPSGWMKKSFVFSVQVHHYLHPKIRINIIHSLFLLCSYPRPKLWKWPNFSQNDNFQLDVYILTSYRVHPDIMVSRITSSGL